MRDVTIHLSEPARTEEDIRGLPDAEFYGLLEELAYEQEEREAAAAARAEAAPFEGDPGEDLRWGEDRPRGDA